MTVWAEVRVKNERRARAQLDNDDLGSMVFSLFRNFLFSATSDGCAGYSNGFVTFKSSSSWAERKRSLEVFVFEVVAEV